MGRINILDKHVAELIAAGEVVERPSSVIKELVENSIDAGATTVTVEIKNGGVTFMRVSDNGSGILKDDVRPAFIRHATSKVKVENDLDAIGTLGFRGEALASISSVSHLELITKAREEENGTRYLIEGGEEVSFDDAGCPDGTTFIIRDLFYNVPARMKFLKTDMAEGNAVSNVIDKIALSHPEIAITYIKDGKTALKTTGDGKLMSAIYAVYGREFALSLIPVDYALGGVKVTGYLSKPENARPNRNMQNFFINHRFVICKTAMAAISEACKGAVMIGKFPSCVINIDMSLNAVDVNVHPTKLEVRFLNERPVFDAVYHATKTALMNGDKRIEATFSQKNTKVDPFTLARKAFREKDRERRFNEQLMSGVKQTATPHRENSSAGNIRRKSIEEILENAKPADPFSVLDNGIDREPVKPIELNLTVADSARRIPVAGITSQPAFSGIDIEAEPNDFPGKDESLSERRIASETIADSELLSDSDLSEQEAKTSENEPEDIRPFIEIDENYYRLIGEAFKTYIIIEKNEKELLLIDKHAAHERMVFEKLKEEKGSGSAQMLLAPLTVSLNKIDYQSVITHLDVFSEAGFEIDDFGSGTVIIRSAPQYLPMDDIELSVIEMAGYLTENKKEIRSEKMEWIYHNISCRAAIKGGNRSTEQELIEIAKRVELEDIRHCPHGRPVCIVIKKYELEKQFGRIQG